MDKDFMKYNEQAEFFKLLAHPIRICIVKGLLEKGECNVSHMIDCLELPQSTLSQHLQKLRTGKVIKGTRKGLEVNYKICDDMVDWLIAVMS